ncbi:iron export ABC transporter permease subunit FetB [Clostridium sp. W14A]|uniref:Iron export ABC transporter permease subunit FetB n=1 Tax=Caproicibacter fermentans TaxID=2576756 RepID=A0A7G8T9L4_9FIRM|nr:iron export ABC transporter permease subunit FetB [Caproicibacter fermentans]OCN01548.1 iron export ABC transporter permease subunit FetB [Clostridium sp. W14A]QNK40305.1 iron export ABC transporter permease subunit FetB [Caproicibacter fermentans]
MNEANISFSSLMIASLLVFVSLLFSYFQKLKLEKEILVSVLRAVVQLIAVGYVLQYIFGLESPLFTTLFVLLMTFNASYNAAKRGKGIRNGLLISFVSIGAGAGATLSVLVASGAIRYVPNQIIPVGGMIISNAMVALGLCYRQITADFQSRRDEIETKLSLGADILPSSIEIIRDSIRTGMVPTIDSAKTLGIVSLPGMMTGLILAGTSPVQAVRYQIMVTFMLLSTTAVSSFLACYLCYRGFFNDRKQLL